MTTTHSNCQQGEILIAKYNYHGEESHELSISKNERLILLDDSCLWWKVKRIDSDENGYIPSNFARREKRSLLEKLISKRMGKKSIINPSINAERILSSALVKFHYEAESEDEISLNKGVWVQVIQKKTDGWWLIQSDKQRGWFPSNYLIEKTSDNLSLINQFNQDQHGPSSNRHNSHPVEISPSVSEEYPFGIQSSKFAHSDGTLDTTMFHNESTSTSFNIEHPAFFAGLTRDDAEKYLKIYGKESGDFLLRDSERRSHQFTLSIRADAEIIRHFRIEYSDDEKRFYIGKRSFSTIDDLLEHYHRHAVFDADPNQKLYLRNAVQLP